MSTLKLKQVLVEICLPLITCLSCMASSINNNKNMYVAFIDYTKAFDYVVRNILWYKLIKLE